jgi:hypothetical protein
VQDLFNVTRTAEGSARLGLRPPQEHGIEVSVDGLFG